MLFWQKRLKEYVLAFATLGDATKNRNNPIFCHAAQEQC
jgi:hypothetical protein